jgi:hypothetical protein
VNASILPRAPLATAGAWLRTPRWRLPLLVFAAPPGLLVVFEALAYSPLGSDWLILVDVTVFAMALLAVFAVLALLASMLLPRLRRESLRALPLPVLFIAGTALGVLACIPIRTLGWERLAARGDGIVAAIHAFEASKGLPPATLRELVPAFLPAVPGTGLGSRPQFRYEVSHGKPGDATFRLWTKLPGISHVADFEYLPASEVEPWHTVVERVGAWAVVAND